MDMHRMLITCYPLEIVANDQCLCIWQNESVLGPSRGGKEKWNYNTKYTYNETNKTIIVKVTWHRTRTGMHTQRKQSWEYGCQSRLTQVTGTWRKTWLALRLHNPRHSLSFSCSCASLSLYSDSLRPYRAYKSRKNISFSWPWIFKSYSVDIWHTCRQPKWIF